MGKFNKAPKTPLTFEQKLRKDMPEFTDEVDGLGVAQLEARIAKYAKELQDSEEHKSKNEALHSAQAEAKSLGGPYRDVKRDIGKKTRYLISLIREKGGT